MLQKDGAKKKAKKLEVVSKQNTNASHNITDTENSMVSCFLQKYNTMICRSEMLKFLTEIGKRLLRSMKLEASQGLNISQDKSKIANNSNRTLKSS